MGYSISVRFPKQEERDRMLAFLHTLDWEALEQAEPLIPATLVAGEDLAYPPEDIPGALLVGFNAGLMPFSGWAVAAWLATQSSFRHKGEPVFYYDTERHAVVPPGKRGTREQAVEADAQGFMVVRKPEGMLARWMEAMDFRIDKQAVLAWVADADQRWQAFCTHPAKPNAPKLR